MFYIFYAGSLPRVLRKRQSLNHWYTARGIVILPRGYKSPISLTTDTIVSRFRDIGKHWHEFFPYNEIIIIYILVYLCKERSGCLIETISPLLCVFLIPILSPSLSLSIASLRKVVVEEASTLLLPIRSVERKVSYRTFGFLFNWKLLNSNMRLELQGGIGRDLLPRNNLGHHPVCAALRQVCLYKEIIISIRSYLLLCEEKTILLSFNFYFYLFIYSFISLAN